ncbi:MAG: hypothetical protein ACJASM_000202 [Salibacteraceae bacterium]|jgi:hypothetical protein
MQFCQFKFEGSDFKILSEQHLGSEHASINADSSCILAHIYPKQEFIASPKGKFLFD